MVQTSTHGGSCCGMRHIWNFRDEGTPAYIEALVRQIQRVGGNERLQLEVILSDLQTRNNPALVDELARLGFVYTSCWSGQHGTPVHLFLRAAQRRALSEANFYNRWVNEHNGMLPHPDLGGTLPLWRDTVAATATRPPRQDPRFVRERRYNNIIAGDRVRVANRNSQLYGQEGVVTRNNYDERGRYTSVLDLRRADGRSAELSCWSLEIVERVAEPVPPAPPAPPAPVRETYYRHPTNPAGWPEPAQQPAVEAPARRLILSQFYCVFRNTGQASRVFATLQEGAAVYPNALNWHERRVYSDGEIVEGPVNNG